MIILSLPPGFGTSNCAVTVTLGSDHSCAVTSVNDKRIRCKVDITSEPPVYTLFEAKVNILGIINFQEIYDLYYVPFYQFHMTLNCMI